MMLHHLPLCVSLSLPLLIGTLSLSLSGISLIDCYSLEFTFVLMLAFVSCCGYRVEIVLEGCFDTNCLCVVAYWSMKERCVFVRCHALLLARRARSYL